MGIWNIIPLVLAFGAHKVLHLAVDTARLHPSSAFFCVSHCNIDGGNITVGMKQPSKEGEGNNDWIVSGVLRPPFPATEGGSGKAGSIFCKGHLRMGQMVKKNILLSSLRGSLPESVEA